MKHKPSVSEAWDEFVDQLFALWVEVSKPFRRLPKQRCGLAMNPVFGSGAVVRCERDRGHVDTLHCWTSPDGSQFANWYQTGNMIHILDAKI